MKNILIIILTLIFVSCVENTSNRRRVANRPSPSNVEGYKLIHSIRTIADSGELDTYEYKFNSDSTWIEFTCFDNHNHKIPVNAIRNIKTE